MDIKQRISALTAAALPVFAIVAFLTVSPAKAKAGDDPSCPNGGVYAPAANDYYDEGLCGAGMGGAASPGDVSSFPVFCATTESNPVAAGQCDPGGTGCVFCYN